MSRNRVIYQSEALFASQKSSNESTSDHTVGGNVEQLHRVQSANYAFNISRTDVNQFGELGAIDRVVLETPTVSLDFSYYLANFANEEALGFTVGGTSEHDDDLVSAVSSIIDNSNNQSKDEKNYFIKTVGEGLDAVSENGKAAASGDSVIGIGNAFLTSYSVEASVGGFPTVSVAAEGMNMRFDSLDSNAQGVIPSLDKIEGVASTEKYSLPPAKKSVGAEDSQSISTLRPGDIKVSLVQSKNNWLVTKSTDSENTGFGNFGENPDEKANDYDLPGVKLPSSSSNAVESANIQSFNISFDLSRTPIQRLGNRFAFAREIDFPVNITTSFEAVLTDLTTGSLSDLIDCEKSYDLKIELYSPDGCQTDGTSDKFPVSTYIVKDLKPDSQSFTSSIGDNKTVSIEFTSQIGGPEQKDVGLFMRGISKTNIQEPDIPPTFTLAYGADASVGMEEGDVRIIFSERVRGVGGSVLSSNDFDFRYNGTPISSDNFDLFTIPSDSKSIVLRVTETDLKEQLIANPTLAVVDVKPDSVEDYASPEPKKALQDSKHVAPDYPVITLLGDNPFNLALGTLYANVDPSFTAIDAEGGDVSGSVVVAGDTVDENVAGTYTITYTVTDSNGLSTNVSRDVVVA